MQKDFHTHREREMFLARKRSWDAAAHYKGHGRVYRKGAKSFERDEVRRKRAEKILDLYKSGKTLEQIGQEYAVTRERIRQILNKCPEYLQHGIKLRPRTYKEITKKQVTCLWCGVTKEYSVGKITSFCNKLHKACYIHGLKSEAEYPEWHRKQVAANTRRWYREVLKKKPNWREIIKERNRRYIEKRVEKIIEERNAGGK